METDKRLLESINNCDNQVTEEESQFGKNSSTYIFIFLEVIILVFFSLFTVYEMDDVKSITNMPIYPLFQDVNVMIFIGFGFLMTFLKKYSWSSVGKNFLISAWTIQLSLLTIGIWKALMMRYFKLPGVISPPKDLETTIIVIDIPAMTNALFAAASILISFGAVLGKLTVIQLLVMATIETIFYSLSVNIVSLVFVANDVGGSMTIHTFGAYFGLSVALTTKRGDSSGHPLNSSNYNSNLFAMIGTVFLFMYWPSFNAVLALDTVKQRCCMNTIISICGSCVAVFLLTRIFRKGKFHMENILNATLAGGVAIGASADIIIAPWISFLTGIIAGLLSLLGFERIGPWLERKTKLHDTCGVNNLHGMTGILGGLVAAFLTLYVKKDQYGPSTFSGLFPLIAQGNTSNITQAIYGLSSLLVVFTLAIVSGLGTGLIINSSCFTKTKNAFDDEEVWVVPEEESSKPLII